MRPQVSPITDFSKAFDKIIENKDLKYRTRLEFVKPQLINRANDYKQKLGALCALATTTWSDDDGHAMKTCYSSETIGLNELKNDLLKILKEEGDINLLVCPYCMLRKPDSWDHYFPQESYPEFSVFPTNLVYVCSVCNKSKLAKKDETQLIFVHPYFYDGPNEPILHCSAKTENNQLSLQFYCATFEAKYNKIANIAQHHIIELNLEQDYQLESAQMVAKFITEIQNSFPKGIQFTTLNEKIETQYSQVKLELGQNSWEAALWRALFNNNDFYAYLSTELMKPPPIPRIGIDSPVPPPPVKAPVI